MTNDKNKNYIYMLAIISSIILGCILCGIWYYSTNRANAYEGAGLTDLAGNRAQHFIIDFNLEIAGFTASRAGTYTSPNQTGGNTISFDASPIIANTNRGTEEQNNQWAIHYWQKYNVGDDQNRIVKMASIISNNDIDWITTLEAENGLWDMYRIHPYRNSNGTYDVACGLNSAYHLPFITRIKNKEVTEKEILEYCYNVYSQRHGAFYGYYKRKNHVAKFYWK